MASFAPFKKYLLFCVDRLIEEHDLIPPFLDIGCGIGDASKHLAAKGWDGEAIDFSPSAIQKAKTNLSNVKSVKVKQSYLSEEGGIFNTVLALDVLEHMEDDISALKKINSLLQPGGHLIISVPSNPGEWRWDDIAYGHYRRYSHQEIMEKLTKTGFSPITCWDFTYPIFWIMRRVYTRLKRPPADISPDKIVNTIASSSIKAWDIPILSKILQKNMFLWKLIYRFQFNYFKEKINIGYEIIILATKTGAARKP